MEDIRQVLISIEKVFEVEHDRSTAHVYKARYFVEASGLNHVLSTTDIDIPKQLLLTLCRTIELILHFAILDPREPAVYLWQVVQWQRSGILRRHLQQHACSHPSCGCHLE